MTFEKWWENNQPEGQINRTYGRDIAKKLWDDWQKANNRTIKSLRKEHERARAYRETLKRVSQLGCKKRGRCVSKRVDDDYCTVCRPIMNVLFDFSLADADLLKVIFASDCPTCKGLGSPDPSPEVGGLPDPPCKDCGGVGSLFADDDA